LVINTGTTVITFLMAFQIQSTQNRDAEARQVTLVESLCATRGDALCAARLFTLRRPFGVTCPRHA
jgi:low affinity Fe/Cu permease